MNINKMSINLCTNIHEDYRRSLPFSKHFLVFSGFLLCTKHIITSKIEIKPYKYFQKSNVFMHVTCVKVGQYTRNYNRKVSSGHGENGANIQPYSPKGISCSWGTGT